MTCNIGTLGVNATATVDDYVDRQRPGTFTNTASITAAAARIRCRATTRQPSRRRSQLASCSAVTFTGPTPYAGSAGPTAVVRLVDMNHDGHLDAVATHETNPGGVDVFLNDGAGHFAAPRFTSTP